MNVDLLAYRVADRSFELSAETEIRGKGLGKGFGRVALLTNVPFELILQLHSSDCDVEL